MQTQNKHLKLIRNLLYFGIVLFFIFSIFTNNNFLNFLENNKDSKLLINLLLSPIQLLKVLIWPIIILFIALKYKKFFKKLFAYMSFSLREFGFFGNKGKLYDVKKLIRKKVKQEYKKDEERKVKEDLVKLVNKEKSEKQKTIQAMIGLTGTNVQLKNKIEEFAKHIKTERSISEKLVNLITEDLNRKVDQGQLQEANEDLEKLKEIYKIDTPRDESTSDSSI